MEVGRVQLLNTEISTDNDVELRSGVGACVGQGVVWYAKVINAMREKT